MVAGAPTPEDVAQDMAAVYTDLGLFLCLQCMQSFTSAGARGMHYAATGHTPEFSYTLPETQVQTRRRRSFREKRSIINQIFSWQRKLFGDLHRAKIHVSMLTGVHPNLLQKWLNSSEMIFMIASTRHQGGLKSYTPLKTGRWHEAEVRLYVKFIYRRRFQALRVSRHWLRRNFKFCRAELGHNVDGWLPSEGWCTRFCRRFQITSQCRTNKKKFSLEERLPKIRQFHQYWIYGVQSTDEQRCTKYGRYPQRCIYSMDQVPMAFSNPSKRSLNEKGAPRGCRFTSASEQDKRFCTIQVTLCADPAGQDVPIELIFRSSSGGARISQEEKDYYASNFPDVRIRWQKKAWADEQICIDYMADFRELTAAKGDVALIMDRHGSQSTARINEMMAAFKIKPIYTPAGCTDCVSPVDHNIGIWLKNRVYKYQSREMDLPQNRNWALPANQGGLTDPEKRRLTVRWMSQAWADLKERKQEMLLAAFVSTGCLIAKDGSENHLIKLWPRAPLGAYDFTPDLQLHP